VHPHSLSKDMVKDPSDTAVDRVPEMKSATNAAVLNVVLARSILTSKVTVAVLLEESYDMA
jgi:hypothetical protein